MVSKDIVHRDLKPQNILMNHEGRSVKNPQPQDIKLKIGKINHYKIVFCNKYYIIKACMLLSIFISY